MAADRGNDNEFFIWRSDGPLTSGRDGWDPSEAELQSEVGQVECVSPGQIDGDFRLAGPGTSNHDARPFGTDEDQVDVSSGFRARLAQW
jgi:hypothetical protein